MSFPLFSPAGRALLSIHLAALLFGLVGLFGALSAASPLLITFARALFACLALALFLRAQGGAPVRLSARQHGLLAFCGVLLALHWWAFFQAVQVASVAIAVLGFAAFPVFVTLLESLLLKTWPTAVQWLALALVFTGLLLVAPDFSPSHADSLGLFWALLSALLFAVLSLTTRFSLQGLGSSRITLWMTFSCALSLAPFAAPELPSLTAMNWFWLLLLGLLCTALAHSLIIFSLQRLGAGSVSMILALEAVYGIAFAWLLLAQVPTARMLCGGALIVGASVLISRFAARKPSERSA